LAEDSKLLSLLIFLSRCTASLWTRHASMVQ